MFDDIVVEIVEQPVVKERFRYKSEGKTPIFGDKPNTKSRSFPSFRVLNYTGPAVVIVSCVSVDPPHRAHPNSLAGSFCDKGVVKMPFRTTASNPNIVPIAHVGIQCCIQSDVRNELTQREKINVDPFKAGFKHKNSKIIEPAVRLCLQVFLQVTTEIDGKKQEKLFPLKPVVTNEIRDQRIVANLTIFDISDSTSPPSGGKKIIIFTEKIFSDDIVVRFFRERADKTVEWEANAVLEQVHKKIGIAFKTPPYVTTDIDQPVNVLFQLLRPSDNQKSKPQYFRYVPDYTNINVAIRNKKRKWEYSGDLFELVQEFPEERKMTVNIDPNQLTNPIANPPEAPVTQSNFVSNFAQSKQQQNRTPTDLNQATANPPGVPVEQSNFVSNVWPDGQNYHHQQQNWTPIDPNQATNATAKPLEAPITQSNFVPNFWPNGQNYQHQEHNWITIHPNQATNATAKSPEASVTQSNFVSNFSPDVQTCHHHQQNWTPTDSHQATNAKPLEVPVMQTNFVSNFWPGAQNYQQQNWTPAHPNQVTNATAITQSSFGSNLYPDAQNYQHKQQNCYAQNGGDQSYNFTQTQFHQPQTHFPQPPNSQLNHSQMQHSQFQPQANTIHSKASSSTPYTTQVFSDNYVPQRQQQQEYVQQTQYVQSVEPGQPFSAPSNVDHMYPCVGYGGKNLLSSTHCTISTGKL